MSQILVELSSSERISGSPLGESLDVSFHRLNMHIHLFCWAILGSTVVIQTRLDEIHRLFTGRDLDWCAIESIW